MGITCCYIHPFNHITTSTMQVHRQKAGFTLLELMISMMAFAIIALGLMANVMWNRKVAHELTCDTAAYATVCGVLDQLRVTPYTMLLAAALNSSSVEVTVVQTSAPAGSTEFPTTTVNVPANGTWTTTVPITMDAAGQVMERVNLVVNFAMTSLESTTTDNLDLVQIDVNYTWSTPSSPRPRNRQLTVLVSSVAFNQANISN